MTTTEQPAVAEITPRDLYARLLAGAPLLILDVRNEDEFQRARIEGHAALQVINLPYFAFLEDEDAAAARVPQGHAEIVVVCAKGGSSQYVAEVLSGRGLRAVSLGEGMLGWGSLYDVRDVVSADWGRIVQIARPARGDLSFAVISGGQAAVIDPLRAVEVYRDLAAAAGAAVRYVLDTHAHADHLSGGPALARATGAPYLVHAYDAVHPLDLLPATVAYTHIQEGDRLQVGAVELSAHWFPGHTLGQLNYRLVAPDGQTALFTGDGLFLRSFGRPDLGGRGEAWTPLLYRSLTERLPRIAEATTLILPAHFGGLAEARADGVFAAPYADVLAGNDALRFSDEASFTDFVLGHLPAFPPEYVEIKRVNLGLAEACDGRAAELELGKNSCALSE